MKTQEITGVNYVAFKSKQASKKENKLIVSKQGENGKKLIMLGAATLAASAIAAIAIYSNKQKKAAEAVQAAQNIVQNTIDGTGSAAKDIRKCWSELIEQAQKNHEAVQDGYGSLIYADMPYTLADGSTKTNVILDLDHIPTYFDDNNPKVSHYPYILSKELRACGKAPDIIKEITTKADGTSQAVEYSLLHLPDIRKTMNDSQVATFEIPRARIVATTTDYNQAGEITSQSKVLVKRMTKPSDITWRKKVGDEIHYYSGNKLNRVLTSSKYYPDSKVVKQTFRDSSGKQYIVVYDKTKKMDRTVTISDNELFATNLHLEGQIDFSDRMTGSKQFNIDDIVATLKANRFSEEVCSDVMMDVEKILSLK